MIRQIRVSVPQIELAIVSQTIGGEIYFVLTSSWSIYLTSFANIDDSMPIQMMSIRNHELALFWQS